MFTQSSSKNGPWSIGRMAESSSVWRRTTSGRSLISGKSCVTWTIFSRYLLRVEGDQVGHVREVGDQLDQPDDVSDLISFDTVEVVNEDDDSPVERRKRVADPPLLGERTWCRLLF